MVFLKKFDFFFIPSNFILIFALIVLCIKSFNINNFGFYRFHLRGSEVVNIDMSSEDVNAILQYPHQTENFLEAKIITSPENTTDHLLDPTQDAIVSGSLIQLRVFNLFTSIELLLWIIPKEMCPLISFTLPNLDSFSITISSSKLSDTFCVFTNDYQKDHVYFFGSSSNSTISRFELYSKNVTFMHDVCYDYYCKTQISGSIFFWFRNEEAVSMKSFIRVHGLESSSPINLSRNNKLKQPKFSNNKRVSRFRSNKTNIYLKNQSKFNMRNDFLYQSEIVPLPYYNSTNKYNVGKDFDEKTISFIESPIESRRTVTFITTMIALGVTCVFIILQIIDGIIILWKSRRANRLNANGHTAALPITLVLNHYCPNTSAKIVMPNY